jgi:antitoxin component YwqK of YwqJK toxin-antitoxin module
MRKILLALFCLPSFAFAQMGKQKNTSIYYKFEDVFDSSSGIFIYENFNSSLGGDSIRNNSKGYAVTGWWQDFYVGNILLHEGYYIEGQLKIYKNYYPSGKLERYFHYTDNNRFQMILYYENGNVHSDITYYQGEAETTYEYFPDGSPEYIEEKAKKNEYLITRKFYYAKDKLQSSVEISDKKRLVYNYKGYHENGQLEEEGAMQFYGEANDVVKEGVWKVYDITGKQTAMQEYAHGQLIEEKKL